MKTEFDDQDRAEFAEFSKVMLSVPDEVKPQVYAKGVQRFGAKFSAMGFDPPQDYNKVMPLFQQAAGAVQNQDPADVRSNQWYLNKLGYKAGSPEEQKFLRMRAGQEAKAVPYGFKYDDYGNAYIENRNKGTLGAAGIEPSGNNQAMPPPDYSTSGDYIIPNDPRVLPQFNDAMGRELAQAQAYAKQRMDAGLWTGEQAAQFVETVASDLQRAPAQSQPTQARIGVAPKGQMTEYQAEMLALKRQKDEQAAADRKAKIDNANALKSEAAKKRNEAVVLTVDDTLNTIDALEKSPGYSSLGTVSGDIQINTPYIRNDAKDANETLKTLAGQIALSTMANLKTLSAAGATGFGALTAPELNLLQNSIDTLKQENVSNARIVASIKVIKEKMKKIKEGALGGNKPSESEAPASNGWSYGGVK
jgi:hypothetical protein